MINTSNWFMSLEGHRRKRMLSMLHEIREKLVKKSDTPSNAYILLDLIEHLEDDHEETKRKENVWWKWLIFKR